MRDTRDPPRSGSLSFPYGRRLAHRNSDLQTGDPPVRFQIRRGTRIAASLWPFMPSSGTMMEPISFSYKDGSGQNHLLCGSRSTISCIHDDDVIRYVISAALVGDEYQRLNIAPIQQTFQP